MKEKPRFSRIINIPIEKISPNPNQPRQYFDRIALAELAKSIAQNGVIHPITVRPYRGGYQLISGERRVRASIIAGFGTIPAIVIHTDEEKSAVLSLLENLQREDLSFFEVAQGYKKLLRQQEITREQLAAQLGKNTSSIANKIRLLNLPAKVRKLIRDLRMSERHANALLSLKDEDMQIKSLFKMHERRMSPSQAEEYIESVNENLCTSPDMVQIPRVKDINGLTGMLKKAVNQAKKSGMEANMKQTEYDGGVEYIIKVKAGQE